MNTIYRLRIMLIAVAVVGVGLSLWLQPARAAGPWYVANHSVAPRSVPDDEAFLNTVTAGTSATIYVDASNNTGIEDGTQAHPFNTIQEGLGVASNGDTVQVAAGTYYERITLKNGVQLLGAGAEVTFIDSTGQNDSVVTASNIVSGTLLDGFTIMHGTGKWIGGYTYGGGLNVSNSSLVLKNCIVTENGASDGAGGLQVSNSTITIDNCAFSDNSGWWGGAITIDGGVVTIQNSIIDKSSAGYGGAIFITNNSQTTIVNSLVMRTLLRFAQIPAIGIGASSTATITNNTLVANAGNGIATNTYATGGSSGGSATIKNNILWDNNDDLVNLTATYSAIEDGDLGEGNISTYPLFIDPANGDYRLQRNSPCIDAGINNGAPLTDFEGDPRPVDGDGDGIEAVDIGADEFHPLVVTKWAASDAAPGSPLTYKISLDNTGVISITDVLVTDTLPVSLTYQNGSLTATDGDYGYNNGVITWTESLDPGGIVTITYGTVVTRNVTTGTPLINSVVISGGGNVITRTATSYVDFHHIFLPLVTKPRPGISGRVTINGASAAGVSLELRFFNGASWSTRATTTTGSDGGYSFTGVPGLSAGQRYYVLYRNTGGTPGRLWVWGTRVLTSYTAGDSVGIGDFDIADIALVSPAAGATVALPYTFQWTRRPATPSDSYEFDLYDYPDGDPYFYTDPPLGYVSAYTLNGLPSGFSTGVQYAWDIWVYSPDGGYGISYWSYYVTFSNTGMSFTGAMQSVLPKTVPDWEEQHKP